MRALSSVFLLFIASISLPVFASGTDYESAFNCDGEEKFNWYCDQIKLKKTNPKEYESKQLEREKAVKAFDIMAKDLEDTRKIAIMSPTPDNLKEYIGKQLEAQNKAAVFTDTWKRVQWANPELDYSTRFGTSAMARQESDALIEKKQTATLKELSAQAWGMFFFYRSDCPYCHRMVPSVNRLAEDGMSVLPVSVDGKYLSDLAMKSEIDKGQADTFKVKQVPTVVLVNTKSKQVIPIASGAATYTDIAGRIYTITQTKPGDNY